jgi:Fe-S-cluster-containing dehydrogenase component
MVLDLNKCLGCHTCTVACKTLWNKDQGTDYAYWNNVETMPGKGYPARTPTRAAAPQGRGQARPIPDHGRRIRPRLEIQPRQGDLHGRRFRTKEWLRPEGSPKWGPNWDEDHGEGSYPQDNHYFYLPRLCNHCTHPGLQGRLPARRDPQAP